MNKYSILSIILAFMAFGANAQESMTFAYASKQSPVSPIGSMRMDQYDVAIALTSPSVYGMTITSIDVPVLPSANISDLSVWLSKKLRLQQSGSVKVNVPDLSFPLEMPTEGNGVKWITLNLDEPYTIPDGGVYVGYSFSVNKLDDSNVTRYPVVATTGYEPGSLYLHTTRTYKTWEDRSQTFNAISMVQVTMQGNTIPQNAARLGSIPFKYVAANADNSISVMVYNVGSEPISSLEYTAIAGSNSISSSMDLESPLPATFGYGEPVEFTLPTFYDEGECNVALNITAINGEACSGITARGKVHVALFVPRHVALVEEYTGMWCGNCPRGFVAMELMNEWYPDFVGIAYHNNDPIAMESGDPKQVEGYPGAVISRTYACDPYFADPASSTFSLPQVWKAQCEEFTPVAIDVEATWNEEEQTVTATSTINWAAMPSDIDTENYRIEYVLLADGLSNPRWTQVNYYANGKNGYPEYMDEFTHGNENMRGLVFNDVAMLTSGFKGVKGSIPSIEIGQASQHTYVFDTKEAYTSSGTPFPFDKNKLRVAAFVLKGAGIGIAINANKCDVKTNSGIDDAMMHRAVVGYEFYDLSGRKVASPQSGIYVKQTIYADGLRTAQKVAIK